MKLADFLKPRKPGNKFLDNHTGQYWIEDGVHFRYKPIRGADAESFRYYLGGYAIDKKACYSSGKRLTGADLTTFRILNFTFAKDKANVWCMGIRMPTADAKTFAVCDDGALQMPDFDDLVWNGYGKDKIAVYYYDYDGKPTLVKKADPATFVSLDDNTFGKDAAHVFLGAAVIPKADPQTWKGLGGFYSRDAQRVFWRKSALSDVDSKQFKVLAKGEGKLKAGSDGSHWFFFDFPIKQDEFNRLNTGKLKWTVLAAKVNQHNGRKAK